MGNTISEIAESAFFSVIGHTPFIMSKSPKLLVLAVNSEGYDEFLDGSGNAENDAFGRLWDDGKSKLKTYDYAAGLIDAVDIEKVQSAESLAAMLHSVMRSSRAKSIDGSLTFVPDRNFRDFQASIRMWTERFVERGGHDGIIYVAHAKRISPEREAIEFMMSRSFMTTNHLPVVIVCLDAKKSDEPALIRDLGLDAYPNPIYLYFPDDKGPDSAQVLGDYMAALKANVARESLNDLLTSN